jgi:hypothetical protein
MRRSGMVAAAAAVLGLVVSIRAGLEASTATPELIVSGTVLRVSSPTFFMQREGRGAGVLLITTNKNTHYMKMGRNATFGDLHQGSRVQVKGNWVGNNAVASLVSIIR